MARRKKSARARKNPFKNRKIGRVYETKEHRVVRHGDAAKSAASRLLLARKKAKKQHKKMPKRIGRLATASATIALHMGGKRKPKRSTKQSRIAKPRAAKTRAAKPRAAKPRAAKPRAAAKPKTIRATKPSSPKQPGTVRRTAQDLFSFAVEAFS